MGILTIGVFGIIGLLVLIFFAIDNGLIAIAKEIRKLKEKD